MVQQDNGDPLKKNNGRQMTLLDTSEERTLDRSNCKNCTIISIDIFKGVNFF